MRDCIVYMCTFIFLQTVIKCFLSVDINICFTSLALCWSRVTFILSSAISRSLLSSSPWALLSAFSIPSASASLFLAFCLSSVMVWLFSLSLFNACSNWPATGSLTQRDRYWLCIYCALGVHLAHILSCTLGSGLSPEAASILVAAVIMESCSLWSRSTCCSSSASLCSHDNWQLSWS